MVDTKQGRGNTTRLVFQEEATYKTAIAAVDRLPQELPYFSNGLNKEQPQEGSELIRNVPNEDTPFLKNIDVAGDIVVPLDFRCFHWWMKMAIGHNATIEVFPNDIMVGSPTVTISTGPPSSAVFNVAQTGLANRSRVIYTLANGTRAEMFIEAETAPNDDTTFDVVSDLNGDGDPAAGSALTVVAIIANKATAVDTTITIAADTGVVTLNQTEPVAIDDQIIYDIDGTKKTIFATSAISATDTFTAVDGLGFPPVVQAGALDVEAIEPASGSYSHDYKFDTTSDLDSFLIEEGITNWDVPEYFQSKGCKISTMELPIGGDDELQVTFGIMGANQAPGTVAYDAGASPDAASEFNGKYSQLDSAATEGGSTISILQNATISLDNGLDGKQTIGGAGEKSRLTQQGWRMVTGSLSGLFTATAGKAVLTKAQNNTTSAIVVTYTNGDNVFTISIPELKYDDKTPPVESGAAGLQIDLDWRGFESTGATDASTITATLVNDRNYIAA